MVTVTVCGWLKFVRLTGELLKPHAAPVGTPVQESITAPVNPPTGCTVSCTMPKVEVDGIVSEEGFVESAKPGDIRLTVKADEATALGLSPMATAIAFSVSVALSVSAPE